MSTKLSIFAVAAVAASLFSFGANTPGANALPISSALSTASPAGLLIQAKTVIVKKRGNRKNVWVYDSHRYGPRYRYRRAGYGYYYGGYYYARPWWGVGVGVPGVNLCIGC